MLCVIPLGQLATHRLALSSSEFKETPYPTMFAFSYPVFFWLLPLPLFIWWFFPRVTPHICTALKVPFFADLTELTTSTKYRFDHQLALLMLITSLLIASGAGPHWMGPAIPLERSGSSIMLVVDISPSMEVTDMLVHGHRMTRLAVVKRAAAKFLHDRSRDQFGLIVFGDKAYLLTPLTYDRTHVLHQLNDITAGLAGKTTSIGDALGLAVKRLAKVPAHSRLIILLTDGVNNSGVLAPQQAAALARAAGISVYTIGLGAEVDSNSVSGMFLSLNGAAADLDEDTLKSIAIQTSGQYFRATDFNRLQQIYKMINQLSKTTHKNPMTIHVKHELYPWPLALALCLLVVFLITLRRQR